jgi:hypothetical protein
MSADGGLRRLDYEVIRVGIVVRSVKLVAEKELKMRIEELREAKNRRPFQPFLIRMAEGREIQVRHPDAIAWGPEHPRTAICVLPDGDWEYIDIALITSLGVPAPMSTATDQGHGEGAAT